MTMHSHDVRLPNTIGTPEGDNETDLYAPLTPIDEDLQTPPGSAPSPYDADKKPEGVEKFIDEVVRGEFM